MNENMLMKNTGVFPSHLKKLKPLLLSLNMNGQQMSLKAT